MERYRNKAAFVTGAGSGIGAAVCRRLVSYGMTVYGCDRDENALARLREETEQSQQNTACPVADQNASSSADGSTTSQGCFVPMVCDLRNEEAIAKMFCEIKEKSGCAVVCVMSAGVGHKATLLEGEAAQFRDMFEVNVLSSVLCAQMCVKLMRESQVDDGHLVLINSGAGHSVRVGKRDYADFNFYNATKFALTAITEGLRFELRLAKSKIRISQISPGLVKTNFTHSMYPDEGNIIDMLYECTATLEPEDVADAVVHAIRQPPRVQIHDIRIGTNGPDRPADWEKRVAAAKANNL